jgi:hypothetical protein
MIRGTTGTTKNGGKMNKNTAGLSSGFGWRRWSPDMEGSCEYIE